MVRLPVTKFKTQLLPNTFFITFFTRVGYGKAYQTDRMVFVINLPQQLLRQRQDHIKCRQFPGLRNAAGDLAEIVELDFQRQRIPPEVLMFQTGYQFHRSMIQLDNDRRPPVDILLQSMFTPHRLTNAHRFYRTKIYPCLLYTSPSPRDA